MTYTFIGVLIITALAVYSTWRQGREDPEGEDARAVAALIRHSRQDIRFIAFLLAGILLMLGFIADRIH